MEQRRVLVTGASRGIGRAIALRLGEEGWRVGVHYATNQKAALEVVAALGSAVSGMYQADLTDPRNALKLWKAFTADGPADGLVNNAGIYRPISLVAASDREFDDNLSATFALNWESPLRLCRAAVGSFPGSGGKILNVASRVGFRGEAGAAPYSASKAALINLTRALAVELAPRQIQVFGIAPGWVETAMTRAGMGERLPEILTSIPVGRMATATDCAAAVTFLMRDEASYLSGVVIDINGASYFH